MLEEYLEKYVKALRQHGWVVYDEDEDEYPFGSAFSALLSEFAQIKYMGGFGIQGDQDILYLPEAFPKVVEFTQMHLSQNLRAAYRNNAFLERLTRYMES